MTKDLALLELFKTVVCTDKNFTPNEKALKYGIYIPDNIDDSIVSKAIDLYGKKDFNKTFHKSIGVVQDTDLEALVFQQLIHYLTTYGFEAFGMYDKDTVYIPKEALNVPDLDIDNIELIYIKCIEDYNQISDKLETLITSGIALNLYTQDLILTLSDYITCDIDEVKNKEFKIRLYDKLGILPKDAISFIKYLVYKVTGLPYLIDNREIKVALLKNDNNKIYNYLKQFTNNFTEYEKLAKYTNRYGYIYICLRRHYDIYKTDEDRQVNRYINKLMQKGKKTKQAAYTPQILDTLTQIKTIKELQEKRDDILKALNETTIYREVRILNTLIYRDNIYDIQEKPKTVYTIRNGSIHSGYMLLDNIDVIRTLDSLIYSHLKHRLENKLKNKTYYINNNVEYALPTSEKRYISHIPEGTSIKVPKDKHLLVAVYWNNMPNGERVDLDLHLKNRYEEYGWNTNYRDEDSHIVYTGDVTDGAYGATEAYCIKSTCPSSSYLLTLNDFTHIDGTVDFDIIIACTNDIEINNKQFVINPNNIIYKIPMKFNKREVNSNEMTLGVVKIADTVEFYFNSANVSLRTASEKKYLMDVYEYLDNYNKYNLTLKALLEDCGAIEKQSKVMEYMKPVEIDGKTLYEKVLQPVDLDFDINTVDKTTFIKLLQDE